MDPKIAKKTVKKLSEPPDDDRDIGDDDGSGLGIGAVGTTDDLKIVGVVVVGDIVGAVGKLVGIAATYMDAPRTLTCPLHCPLSTQPSDTVYI